VRESERGGEELKRNHRERTREGGRGREREREGERSDYPNFYDSVKHHLQCPLCANRLSLRRVAL